MYGRAVEYREIRRVSLEGLNALGLEGWHPVTLQRLPWLSLCDRTMCGGCGGCGEKPEGWTGLMMRAVPASLAEVL